MKLRFRNTDYVTPPGTAVEILAHPYYGNSRSIELAAFAEHRYAFFFWAKWTGKLLKENRIASPPDLVSLDWHQDLAWPTKGEKGWLRSLDVSNNRDLSLYAWANLSPINDTHIMAAAYLNLIGDIYVHCRQGRFEDHWRDQKFKDRYGNVHTVRKFREYDKLEEFLLNSEVNNVYFDIDLDFFTIQNPLNGAGKNFTYLGDDTIRQMLEVERPLIWWIFQRLCGFTIATEPEHTGGLLRSNRYLALISKLYFSPVLFANYGEQWKRSCRWKHLPEY